MAFHASNVCTIDVNTDGDLIAQGIGHPMYVADGRRHAVYLAARKKVYAFVMPRTFRV